MWTMGYDYNHSSVNKLGQFDPQHGRKGSYAQKQSTRSYQSSQCRHKLLSRHHLTTQSGGQKYPGGVKYLFFLCPSQIKMVSAQLPKNSKP